MSDEKSIAKRVEERFLELKKLRSPWEAGWEDIARYVLPRREDIQQQATKGQIHGTQSYDGTPIIALQMMADGIHGHHMSAAFPWFRFLIKGFGLEDNKEVKLWLQEVEAVLYRRFQQSNFYGAMSEYLLDGGSIGTATMLIKESKNNKNIVFSVRHPGECFIDEDSDQVVDTVYRSFKLSARAAVEKFGDAKLSENLKYHARNTPSTDFEFIHAVFPRTDRNVRIPDNKNMPWASVYVELARQDPMTYISESGYRVFPYAVWRWRKNSNELYGRSPAWDAMVDIKKLNQIEKTNLQAGHMQVEPAWNVPAELAGKVKNHPGGLNYYVERDRVISPVNSGIHMQVGIERQERTSKIIEQHFKVSFFAMLANAERQMTATEILERQGEKAALLGPMLGRLNDDGISNIIDRVFDIELNAGRLPELPQILQDFEGQQVDIDYMGPLAQAQKRLFRVQGINNSLQHLMPIIELEPSTRHLVDWDGAGKEVLEAGGMPQQFINTPERIAELKQAELEAQQAAQAKEDMEKMSGSLKNIGEADAAMEGGLGQMIEGLPQ